LGWVQTCKVLLKFGLSPKVWEDLESWSSDLFNLFSYLGDKPQDPSKKEHAEELLTILFDKTLHNGYFGKLPFGSKDKFAKMPNTTLPLVVLRWLCQIEEYFYKIGDTNESGDWYAHRKYYPAKARNVSKEFPLDNIHMIKANSTAVTKITSVQWIKPDIKNNNSVVKSLEEWAAKILCRDNDYVKNKANADDEMKKCFDRTKKHGPNQYALSKRSYKPINQEARNNVNIVNFTPQQQQQKTPDQLFLHLGDFMKGEIETMTKTAAKKMQTKKTSNCSTVQMKLLHALFNLPTKTITKSFHHLKKCKHT
jgi:hypothetical protein